MSETSTATNPMVVQQPWPFGRCPECANDRFIVANDLDTLVTFTCTGCEQRWRYSLGTLLRVPHPYPASAGPVGP